MFDEHTDDDELTDEEKEEVANELTDDDLRERSQALNEAQETWEEISYLSVPKMPCPECTGAGSIIGGSLGDICPRCLGQRVIDRPDADPVVQPDFKALRAKITAYGNALADRALPAHTADGTPHPAKLGLALPPASSVPTLAEIAELGDQAKKRAKELGGAAASEELELASPPEAKGLLADDGDIGRYSDAELDEMESDAEDD